jgi:hypothetical protein
LLLAGFTKPRTAEVSSLNHYGFFVLSKYLTHRVGNFSYRGGRFDCRQDSRYYVGAGAGGFFYRGQRCFAWAGIAFGAQSAYALDLFRFQRGIDALNRNRFFLFYFEPVHADYDSFLVSTCCWYS